MNKSFVISDEKTTITLDIKSNKVNQEEDYPMYDEEYEEYKDCSKCKKYLLLLNFRKPTNKQCIACSESSSIHYNNLKNLASKGKKYIQKILILETENKRLKNTIEHVLKIKDERELTISLQNVKIENLIKENESLKYM